MRLVLFDSFAHVVRQIRFSVSSAQKKTAAEAAVFSLELSAGSSVTRTSYWYRF
jgi:hypothetical protein